MAANSRFAVSLHIMTLLALKQDECLSSERIAKSVHTNAVVVRRILCELCKADLVDCRLGKCGGARLRRNPKKISLLDVYRAFEGDGVFALHAENHNCAVSCHMNKILTTVFDQSEQALKAHLKKTTLSELLPPIA